jgi:hypothetical protein
MRFGDEQVLQRHRQRLRSAVLEPGVRPLRLEQPGRLATVDPCPDGLIGLGGDQRALHRLVAELVLRRRQPVRAHPDTARAERECRGDLPAGADAAGSENMRVGADRVDDVRHEHHRGDLAGVAARLGALRDDDVDAVVDVRTGVLGLAGECGHGHAVLVREVDDVLGRRAERVGDQLDRVPQCDVDVRAGHRVQPAQDALARRVAVSRQRWHAQLAQRVVDELAVLVRDVLAEVGGAALFRNLRRHHDVDAVRFAVGVLVHPVQDGVELLGVVEPDTAQHTEPTRPAHRRRHVLGRREREDRLGYAELVADRGAHRSSPGCSAANSPAHR